MKKEVEASAIWMTHVELQAVSTMLNIDINILTTGLTPESSHRCTRCKSVQEYGSGEELREHNKNIHHKIETSEQREGRLQMARWTEIKPDIRVRETIPKEKVETLFLLHNDDIHYNMIVHRSHNAFHTENQMREHVQENHKTWAKVASAHIPENLQTSEDPPLYVKTRKSHSTETKSLKENEPVDSSVKNSEAEDEGWQTVTNKNSKTHERSPNMKEVKKQSFEIPTQNRYTNLNNTNDNEFPSTKHKGDKCDLCGCMYTSKPALETHKRNTHGRSKRSREGEEKTVDNTSISAQLEKEKKDHKQT